MTGLWPSLARVAGATAISGVVGWIGVAPLIPRGPHWKAERLGWGIAAGLFLTAAAAAFAMALGSAPRWATWLALALLCSTAARILRRPAETHPPEGEGRDRASRFRPIALLAAAGLAAGFLLYLLRAVTEPMWSNDFLAIWGLKGKIIFAAGSIPARLLRDPALGYSHPEYPLGLPLMYAGLASLAGEWDDQALALVFPAFQIATAAVLYGWLRRRGAGLPLALGAAALVALFAPLYSAFGVGLADVPLSCVALLLGSAWSDAIDGTDAAAPYRLALASLLAAATKNEGLFLAVAAALLSLGAARGAAAAPKAAVAVAGGLPALLVRGVQRLAVGPSPLRDLDFSVLTPSRMPELVPRVGEALGAALEESFRAGAPELLCVAALLFLGARSPAGDRLLLLAGIALAAYVLLPALAVRGPTWLIRTSLARTSTALAPLAAAGLTLRFVPLQRRPTRPKEKESPESSV